MIPPVRILYVDDNSMDRDLVRNALEQEAGVFSLVVAATREQFEALLEETSYDVVLSDFNILGFEGLAVIEAVRAKHHRVPVIVVTGTGSEEVAIEAMKRGAADYVIKTPSHIRRLPDTIRAVLETNRTKAALRDSEEKYRNIFENIYEGIFQSTPDGRLITVNPAFARMFGYDSPEETVREVTDIPRQLYVRPEEWEDFEQGLYDQGFLEGYEVECRRKDGTPIWVSVNTRAMRDESGTVLYYEGTSEDVTRRKWAEEALAGSEERFRSLFESAGDAIYILEAEGERAGQIILANPAAAEMHGYTLDELLNLRISDLDTPESAARVQERLERLLRGERLIEEVTHRKKDGTVFPMEINSRLLEIGDHKYILAIDRDITARKIAEAELYLKDSAMKSAISGIALADLDGNLTYVNPAALRLWGYDHEGEVLGKPAVEFWINQEEARGAVRIAGKAGAWIGEMESKRKDGAPLDVEAAITLVRDPNEVAVAVMASFLDISERKRSQAALRESEARFRLAFENANIGVCLVDLQGRLLRVNDETCEMFGYSRSELESMTVNDVAHPEDLDLSPHFIEKAIAGEVDKAEFEKRYIHKRGHVVWGTVSSSLVRDHRGNPLYFISHVRDITEQKRAEEALRSSESFLSSVIDQSPYPMWISDRHGTLMRTNKTLQDLLHISDEEVVGKYNILLDNIVEDQGLLPQVKEVFDKGDTARFQIQYDSSQLKQIPLKQSVSVILDVTVFPIKDAQGRITNAVIQHVDITERKRVEDALRLSEERNRFLANVIETSSQAFGTGYPDGRLGIANRAFCELTGYSEEELRQIKWNDDLTPPEWLESETHHLAELVRTGVPVRYEKEYIRKDGTRVPVELLVHVQRGETGEPLLFQAFLTDLTERKRAETELLRAKKDWEDIFEAIGHPTFVMDLEHNITRANNAAIEVSGKSLDELLNAKCYEVFHESNEPNQGCPMEALLKSGSTATVEMEMEALGGYFLVRCTPYLDDSGTLQGAIHVATDITQRKKSEEALRQSEETHRSLIAHLPQRIFLKDRNSVYLSCNTNYAADLGISPEQIVGKDDFAFYPAELAQLYRADDHACMATGTVRDFEEPYQLAGQERWAHTIKVPYRDEEGRVTGVLGIFEDITDRKKSEEALRESEERYRELFSQSLDGIYVTSLDGELLDANQAFLDILGYKRDDIVGGDIRIIYANPSDRDTFVRAIEASGSVKDYPLSFKRKDGKEVECLLTSNARRAGDGAIMGYQGIVRDVTEHKSLQKQLLQAQKMEAIGTLAGGVAHDFNNILQVTLGYSELILGDEGLPQGYRADVQKINQFSRRGADLVQRLLTFSRKTEIKPQPLNLNRRITEMRTMIERTIPKMIDIQLILAEDLAAINADPTQVDQVLMNLAVNARDAMPDGGRLVIETANITFDQEYAKTHLDAKPGRYVLLMVTDTGAGMDEETLEHIFEPFYTTKAVGEGTGLGLAMVHGIVRQHGGHIRCYSEAGQGTTFKIYFPALVSEEELQETVTRTMPRGGSETILLVDDEDLIRDLGSKILTKAGYKVITASNGKEALNVYQARSAEIALVLLDLIMPQMGGTQCLEGLLRLNPAVKVVIASGYSADGPTKEALAAGAKGFVNKPYDIRQLLGVVRQVLDAE